MTDPLTTQSSAGSPDTSKVVTTASTTTSKPSGPSTTTLLAHERTTLATQRTVLAWTRTAITFMAFGVALAKFSLFTELFHAQATLIEGFDIPPHDTGPTHLISLGLVFVGVLHALVSLAYSLGQPGPAPGGEDQQRWRRTAAIASTAGTLAAGLALLAYLAFG